MKKRTGRPVLVTAIIVLVLVGFWLYASLPMPATQASKVATAAVKAGGTARPILERVQSHPAKSQLPPHRKLSPGELPGQVVAQVAISPDAKTPDGDYATAIALERCAHVRGTDAEIEERETKASLHVDALRQSLGVPIPDKASVEETIEVIKKIKQERDSCAGISKDQIDSWRARLEAMAQAGDMQARQRLIDSINIDFPSQAEINANRDEYDYRKALAEDYLLDRLAEGDCSQATLTSLANLGLGAETSYVFYRIYAERTLASLPNPHMTPQQNDEAIAHLKSKLANLEAQVPLDAMDDANQSVAYLRQRGNCER